MPVLSCMATTCIYNKDELCSRGDIEISGTNAQYADETACRSFRDSEGGSIKSSCTSTGCGCSKIDIKCEAEKCVYNSDLRCTAGQVNIDGACASHYEETECETFKMN